MTHRAMDVFSEYLYLGDVIKRRKENQIAEIKQKVELTTH